MRSIRVLLILCSIMVLVGCAKQPVVWHNTGEMNLTKGGRVTVKALCEMPPSDISYLQSDIQQKVQKVLSGKEDTFDSYNVEVEITRYDEGNAFARSMLIGLGQMYLDGTVEITQGDPPVLIREGEFKKNYCVGGLVGASATMQKTVLPEVGNAIIDAILKQ